jgi:Flp pilus assembly protein TadB
MVKYRHVSRQTAGLLNAAHLLHHEIGENEIS